MTGLTDGSLRARTRLTGDGHPALGPVREHLRTALRGKDEVIELVLACVLARGHLLIEDRPGLGKTTLAKALAAAMGGHFARVQCTPDLLPSDITGFNIFDQRSHQFEFRRGPAFADVLLADEINRATPRTQSALLEAMAERQVTVDGALYPLSPRFFVIATQNPADQHGTYPLPEAQLDRFAMKLSIGYPDREDERRLLAAAVEGALDGLLPLAAPLLSPEDLGALQQRVARVPVAPALHDYQIDRAAATRSSPQIPVGISPRGVLTWQRVAQARAYLEGRDFVTPDDVQHVAVPVLAVRLPVERDHPETVIRELLEQVPIPRYLPPPR